MVGGISSLSEPLENGAVSCVQGILGGTYRSVTSNSFPFSFSDWIDIILSFGAWIQIRVSVGWRGLPTSLENMYVDIGASIRCGYHVVLRNE